MSIQHVARHGKVYHLQSKPGKNGKLNYSFSRKPDGAPVDTIPKGFEIYETVRGQVFLRLIQPKLITDQELQMVRTALNAVAEEWKHKIEIRKNQIIIHAAQSLGFGFGTDMGSWLSPQKIKEFEINNATYMLEMRFSLVDAEKRIFLPERFCYRGSVEDWIDIGSPDTLPKLLKKFFKHLGKDSLYELY